MRLTFESVAKAVAINTSNFVEIKEKHRRLPSVKVVGSLH